MKRISGSLHYRDVGRRTQWGAAPSGHEAEEMTDEYVWTIRCTIAVLP